MKVFDPVPIVLEVVLDLVMIAARPLGPVIPIGPVAPVGPVIPIGPVEPRNPLGP